MRKKSESIFSINLDKALSDLQFISGVYDSPTRIFEVSEEVEFVHGNSSKGIILEVRDDKFYLVKEDGKDQPSWFPWIDLKKLGSKRSETSFSNRSTFNVSFSNRQIDALLFAHYSWGTNSNPSYQRELVWGPEDKVNLIDSIFMGLDIGKFVFIPTDSEDLAFEILDGKQRMNAIVEFTQDRFSYKGLFFSELSREDKMHFKRHLIAWGETKSNLSEKEKILYFLRLNGSGHSQNQKHLENLKKRISDED